MHIDTYVFYSAQWSHKSENMYDIFCKNDMKILTSMNSDGILIKYSTF